MSERMTDRQARYVESVCRSAGVAFDPNMTPAEAQAIVTEQRKGWLSRAAVQAFACPKCGAIPDANCFRVNGQKRKANHVERVRLAVRILRAGE